MLSILKDIMDAELAIVKMRLGAESELRKECDRLANELSKELGIRFSASVNVHVHHRSVSVEMEPRLGCVSPEQRQNIEEWVIEALSEKIGHGICISCSVRLPVCINVGSMG